MRLDSAGQVPKLVPTDWSGREAAPPSSGHRHNNRWSDVDLDARILTVSRSMSAGEESSTKSRRARAVPLADQAANELESLRKRRHFRARTDYVFCRPDGGPLDRSAVRTRFVRAQKAASVRVRRFHDLRHSFGSLAIPKVRPRRG